MNPPVQPDAPLQPDAPSRPDALALLRADPRIAAAALASADPRASVLILPEPGWIEQEMLAAAQASRRALRSWETTYDLAYRRPDHPPGPPFPGPSFDGWNSSFTRAPIPLADMQDWLAAITFRLLALPHDRVREIGCGTGLLVETIAPHCRQYDASDFSAVAIASLRDWLATRPDLSHVRATRHAAHESADAAAPPVDLVIINSVAQHFPDAAYLASVLTAAWHSLRPGGHIVIGDTRLLGAQPVFIAAVELARAPDAMTVGGLREAIQAAWLSQSELLIDPGFFHRFAHTHGGSVAVRLKSGRSLCEMTRYRCDVILGKPADRSPPTLRSVTELPDLAALHDWLATRPDAGAVLCDLANARLTANRIAHRRIASCPHTMTVAALRAELASLSEPATDPADIEALAASHGLACALVAPPGKRDGSFEAWFGDISASSVPRPVPADPATLTSNPMLTQALRRLSASLHADLASRLPQAGMPARILPVLHAAELSSQSSHQIHCAHEPHG